MTPKEKALELVKLFIPYTRIYNTKIGGYVDCNIDSKQCALIAVDEIINALSDNSFYMQGETNIDEIIDYWKQIRLKVENL